MSADWDEIKRLAGDLQRAQLLSTSQRLSERNCVEIVTKLTQLGLLDVVHTSTGREYVTPEQISREIHDEVLVSGGRVGLPELASQLNVDFSHVEVRAQRLAQDCSDISLVNGYLISSTYLDGVAEEVNEKLQQTGEMAIGSLATQYDLPAEFLQQELHRRLDSIIQGRPDPEDPRLLFTEAFVAQHTARVRGALSAVTRPVTVQQLLQRHGIREQLFFNVAGQLLGSGRVKGSLTGGRTALRAVFVPDCYTAAQNALVDQQYRQGGCIGVDVYAGRLPTEYESLRRAGISDPEAFVRRRFKDQKLVFLVSCAVGESLVEQVKVSLEEAALAGGYVDVLPLLPSSAGADDAARLLETLNTGRGHTFADSVLVTEKLLEQLRKPLLDSMPERATQDIAAGRYPPKHAASRRSEPEETKRDRKDERRKKAAGGKAGGGTQGRETKTKSTKKKYMQKGRGSDSEDETANTGRGGDGEEDGGPAFLSAAELEERLAADPALVDAPEELLSEIAAFLCRPLSVQYREVLRQQHQSALTAAGQARRGNLAQFQDKVTGLALNVRLFEKGAAEFPADTRSQLVRHLLRTLCTELTNEMFLRAAADADVSYSGNGELSPEARMKILNRLPEDMAPELQKLHKALTAAEMADFDSALDPALGVCGVATKKPDKKKDRQQQRAHLQCLLDQLGSAADAALTLHLAALVLFQTFTGHMLHASGKFVPAIVGRLADLVPAEVLSLLQQCQGLVVRQLKLKPEDPELAETRGQLEQLLPQLKETAASTRRSSTSAE